MGGERDVSDVGILGCRGGPSPVVGGRVVRDVGILECRGGPSPVVRERVVSDLGMPLDLEADIPLWWVRE